MAQEYLLPDTPQYKANLHCHTTVSDGCMTPAQIRRAYTAAGYAVVAFTDHEVMVDHSELSDGHFLALRGYEIAVNDGSRQGDPSCRKTCHIGLIARRPELRAQVAFSPDRVWGNARNYLPMVEYLGDFFRGEYSADSLNEIFRRARAAGFFSVCNHPSFSLMSEEEVFALDCDALEVYNHGSVVLGMHDSSPALYAALVNRGCRPIPLACDDNHNAVGFDRAASDSFGGFTVICAPCLEYTAVTDALARGDCYASTGPLITALFREGERVTLRCSDAAQIKMHLPGRRGEVVFAEGMPLREACFSIGAGHTDAWFEVRDDQNRFAVTRVYEL